GRGDGGPTDGDVRLGSGAADLHQRVAAGHELRHGRQDLDGYGCEGLRGERRPAYEGYGRQEAPRIHAHEFPPLYRLRMSEPNGSRFWSWPLLTSGNRRRRLHRYLGRDAADGR